MPSLPPRLRALLLVGLGLLVGAAGALLVHAFSLNTPLERVAAIPSDVPGPEEERFLELVGLHTGVRFEDGHHVELLLDGGGLFPRLWSEVRAARRSVTAQLYYCAPDRLADSLVHALAVPARAGVPVLFLYDGFGCDLGDRRVDALREAGARVHAFRPVRWWSLHRAQERSHARIVVIDGRVGYTGGFGIDERWSAAGAGGEPGWRETNVRFTGPAVPAFQAAFADGWAESAGELLVGDAFFPPAAPSATPLEADSGSPDPSGELSGLVAGLLHARPDRGSTSAERLLALSIAAADRTLYVANAYFVPDDDFRRLLGDAARRGVDVRILTAGEDSDVPVVRYAGRAHYDELLAAGVRLYEYRSAMMHAKTFVVDGLWASVGSMNFDNRSLAVNDESALLVRDRRFGARMDSLFLDDLRHAREIRPPDFADRGFWQRLKERLAVLSSRAL